MSHKAIVLDANTLIRAVLGKRVRGLIIDNAAQVKFFAPDVAYADARKYLPALLEKRGVKVGAAMNVLDILESIVQSIDHELTQVCNSRPCNALPSVMQTIGLSWHVP